MQLDNEIILLHLALQLSDLELQSLNLTCKVVCTQLGRLYSSSYFHMMRCKGLVGNRLARQHIDVGWRSLYLDLIRLQNTGSERDKMNEAIVLTAVRIRRDRGALLPFIILEGHIRPLLYLLPIQVTDVKIAPSSVSIAVKRGHCAILKILIRDQIATEQLNCDLLARLASDNDQTEMVKLLLPLALASTCKSDILEHCIRRACMSRNTRLVKWLLDTRNQRDRVL